MHSRRRRIIFSLAVLWGGREEISPASSVSFSLTLPKSSAYSCSPVPTLPQNDKLKARKSSTNPQLQDTSSSATGPRFQLDVQLFQAGTEQSTVPKSTLPAMDGTGAVSLPPPDQAQLQAAAARDGGRTEPGPCRARLGSCSGGEPAPQLKWKMKLGCRLRGTAPHDGCLHRTRSAAPWATQGPWDPVPVSRWASRG